jgi:hypothetical protein
VLVEAEQFLMDLDPTTDLYTIQVFYDMSERRDPRLAQIIHGSVAQHASELARLNARGAGIFVCVNATDFKGRGTAHITQVRAVWQDDDYAWQGAFPLPPSLVVSTSPGRFQRLWICDDLTFDQHRVVQERLVASFGHDSQACGLNRVLRLPGFWHMKNPDAPQKHDGGTREVSSLMQLPILVVSHLGASPGSVALLTEPGLAPKRLIDGETQRALRDAHAGECNAFGVVSTAAAQFYPRG